MDCMLGAVVVLVSKLHPIHLSNLSIKKQYFTKSSLQTPCTPAANSLAVGTEARRTDHPNIQTSKSNPTKPPHLHPHDSMPPVPRPFVNDALWRCLCPGFPSTATATATARARLAPKQVRARSQTRGYSVTAQPSTFFAQPHSPPSVDPQRTPFDVRRQRQPPHAAKEKPPLAHLPTHVLYEDLRHEGAKGNFVDVMRICNVLIQDRGQRPDSAMYAAVLHSFTSSTDGTAGKLRKVLDEMGFWSDAADGAEKVDLDVRGCENVLQALAVHPDYLLRAEVLEYMRDKWIPLSDRAHCFVVAGLLRDRLFEQALDMLEDMCQKEVKVDDWLWSEAMWILLEFGEVDEAFYVLDLKESVSGGDTTGSAYSVKLSNALWGALLDAAAHKQLVRLPPTLPRSH